MGTKDAKRTGEKRRGRTGKRAANPRFVALMGSQGLALLGLEVLQFALPLHLLNLTGSGALFGGVVAVGFVPYTLLAPVGGIIADRTRKRGVMVAVNAVLAACMLMFWLVAETPAVIGATIAVLMVAFAAQALLQPCVQSAIPYLVATDELERAIALMNQVGMLTGIGGPVLGGMVFGFFGVEPIAVVSAGLFALGAVVAWALVRVPYTPPARTAGALVTARADMAEALGFLRGRPVLWRTIMAATLLNLFGSSFFNVCSPYIVTETLGLSNQLLGALQAALAIGGLAGGGLIAAFPGRLSIRVVPALLVGIAGTLAAASAAVALPVAPLLAFAALVTIFAATMALCTAMSIVATTYLQVESPETLVGKVMALTYMLANCATPAGQLAYGIALDAVPAWVIGAVAAAMIVLVAAWLRCGSQA
ncbi:MFS transporter [Collinsella tanakaei]|uniref:MFS transporter n=1 Tax=Collinsella tanakaei TaxID=626935 RepID=UPI00195CB343|nr:MFS transporter [Collinsella tanakaei]MBM6755460.1 MFS transporter [Collinsella tanakaei]